jgi:hypothetical protein
LENAEADELAKATTNNLAMPEGTFYQVLRSPATEIIMKASQIVCLLNVKIGGKQSSIV